MVAGGIANKQWVWALVTALVYQEVADGASVRAPGVWKKAVLEKYNEHVAGGGKHDLLTASAKKKFTDKLTAQQLETQWGALRGSRTDEVRGGSGFVTESIFDDDDGLSTAEKLKSLHEQLAARKGKKPSAKSKSKAEEAAPTPDAEAVAEGPVPASEEAAGDAKRKRDDTDDGDDSPKQRDKMEATNGCTQVAANAVAAAVNVDAIDPLTQHDVHDELVDVEGEISPIKHTVDDTTADDTSLVA